MDWIQTVNGLIALITGLLGLVGTGIGAFFAIKNWISATKTKTSQEIWSMILSMADAAIKEAERSTAKGEDKKKMVIEMVKEGCKAAGVDLSVFLDQLNDYIDQTIKFVNDMTKK